MVTREKSPRILFSDTERVLHTVGSLDSKLQPIIQVDGSESYGVQPTIVNGKDVGGTFVAAAEAELTSALGFRPFHGTLNLEGAEVDAYPARILDEVGNDFCDGVQIRACRVAGVKSAVIRPLVPNYPPEKTEVLSPVRLRTLFGVDAGDSIPLARDEAVWPPSTQRADSARLDLFDAVVFDLDRTLVDLAVDWNAVRKEIITSIGDSFNRPIEEYDVPDLFYTAREKGVEAELEAIILPHELSGAECATARPLLRTLEQLSCPVGVCTVNAPDAAKQALEIFDVCEAVDVIVGRGTVPEYKPEPEPLLACLDRLAARPGNAVFVGDLRRDAQTADRADTSFLSPEQLLTGDESTGGPKPP